MRLGNRKIPLHVAITLFVCAVVVLSLGVTGWLIGREVAHQTEANLSNKAMGIARTVAQDPTVIEALEGKRDERLIQSFADRTRRLTGVRFIVVMDMNHIRKSHPDENKIGKKFVGRDEIRAMKGQTYTSVATGTLGTSMRAFVPIRNTDGKQVGVVAVGIMMDQVRETVQRSIRIIYIGTGVGILVGILGAVALAKKIKTVLFGLEPDQIANRLQERNAMLHAVREGIVAVNRNNEIVVANGEALRIFRQAGVQGDPVGRNLRECLPAFRLHQVLESKEAEVDEELQFNGLTLLVNRIPVMVGNRVAGAIATFRDKTEVKRLAEQLTGVKSYAEALRVKSHEFMNRLHVIQGMVEMGEYKRLAGYIRQITDQDRLEVGTISRLVDDPVLAGFLLSKWSAARERGVKLEVTGAGRLPRSPDRGTVDDWITILGNLIDNGMEAVAGSLKKEVQVSMSFDGEIVHVSVRDSGDGIPKENRNKIFQKGFSTKGEDRGYGLFLVQESLKRLGGRLTLSSEGEWTVFTVEIPVGDGEKEP